MEKWWLRKNRDVINAFNYSTMSFYGKGYYYHSQMSQMNAGRQLSWKGLFVIFCCKVEGFILFLYIHTYIHMTNRKWFLFLFLHFFIHCVYRVSYWNDHYWFPDIKAIASWRQIGKCLPFENVSRLNLMQNFFFLTFIEKKH